MSNAVVFAFAVEDGLPPVVGAAPYDVLARQIPRTLVGQLNGGGDGSVRFFPFLGPVDGARSFLRLRQLIDPKALATLHKQDGIDLLVDGCIRDGRLSWRVLNADGSQRLRLELDFDPGDPFAVLPRLTYELVGQLGWTGTVEPETELVGEALGWFLVLKDELLRREADLPEASQHPLRAAEHCVALAGRSVEVQQLVIEFLAILLRRGQHREAVAPVAVALAEQVDDGRVLDRLGGLTFAAGDERAATRIVVRASCALPTDSELAERAAAMAFRAGDDDSVKEVVQRTRVAGSATPQLIAQLAASMDRSGDAGGRAALIDELLGENELPVPVARLVVSFLLDEEQPALARTILERALRQAPEQSMLHYELGRACLMLGEVAAAAVALHRALELGVPERLRQQAERLLRMCMVPGLWHGTQLVEKALDADDLPAALGAARALVRRVADVPEPWLLFGVVQQKLGNLRRAERLLRRAARLDDTCADAHNRIGTVMLQQGRGADAYAHLVRAHELLPEDSATLLHLAQASALVGRLEQAEQQARAARGFGADPALVEAVLRKIRAA